MLAVFAVFDRACKVTGSITDNEQLYWLFKENSFELAQKMRFWNIKVEDVT